MPSYRPQAKSNHGWAANSAATSWVNRSPLGLGTTSTGIDSVSGTSSSKAAPHGSGRITMPGPPP